ncbi:MAG: acyl-CoA thioesterase [Chloroflexi bacterium]|nr:acyl-CoA thioesterase [Chloroflexota bacterium]
MPATAEVEIMVRSTDMDGDMVVNNAVFFTYFEQARLTLLRRLGVIPEEYLRQPGMVPSFTIAETTGRFRAPARFRDVLVMRARVAEVRNRSFSMAYEATNQASGTLVAEGSSVQVWVNGEGQPVPLPEHVRAALAAV